MTKYKQIIRQYESDPDLQAGKSEIMASSRGIAASNLDCISVCQFNYWVTTFSYIGRLFRCNRYMLRY